MENIMCQLVLASASPARHALLTKLNLPFLVAVPDIDETPYTGEPAPVLVQRLAKSKTGALANKYPQHLIIGCDQVCVINNTITGKPHNYNNAFNQLLSCSGQCVTFYTGLALLNSITGEINSICELFKVYFRILTNEEIEGYLNAEQPWYCAGSFKIEGLGITLFKRLEGDDPNTLIGLPLITLTKMLMKEGVNPLTCQRKIITANPPSN